MTDYNRLGVKYMIECNDGMTTIVYTGDGKSVRQLPFGVTMPFTVKEIKQINRFEELRKLAEKAASYKAPDWYPVSNPGAMLVNAQTILAMLDLIEMQHSVVEDSGYHNRDYFSDRSKALCAYNKFKGQSSGRQQRLERE